MTNQDYKNAALAALKGNWAPAVLAAVVYTLIVLVVIAPVETASYFVEDPMRLLGISGIAFILEILVLLPMTVGVFNSYKSLLDEGDTNVTSNLFAFSFRNFGRNLWGMFLYELKLCLWCLLFILPVFVMAFAYGLTPYILKDNPELSCWEASKRSREMMKGHKFDLFWLELSFIGWMLLSIFTLGIGFFWLIPYMQTAVAAFYNDISGKNAPVAVEAAPVAKEVLAEAAPAVEAPAENAEN